MSNSREQPTWTDDFPEIPESGSIFWPSLVFGIVCLFIGLYLILTPIPIETDQIANPRPNPVVTQSPDQPLQPRDGHLLRFAFVDSEDSTFAFAADAIAHRMAEVTQAKTRIETFPSGVVDGKKWKGEKDLVDLVRKGDIEMCLCSTSPLTSYSHELDVLDLPFLFTSYEHAERVLDGPVGRHLLTVLEPYDLEGLGYLELGFRVFSTSDPMPTLADFKGKDLRVMQSVTASQMVKALGANPVTSEVGQIYKMAEEGNIDGADRTFPTYWDFGLNAVHRFVTDTKHTYSTKMVLINLRTWNSLSQTEQEHLRSVVKEVAVLQRERQRQADEDVKERCRQENIRIFELSPAERAKFVRASRPLYEHFRKPGNEVLEQRSRLLDQVLQQAD